MRRSIRAAIVLVSLAAAMCFGFLAYSYSRANSRQGLLDRAAQEASNGSYLEAVRLLDRALAIPASGVPTDNMLYLKKAEYLEKMEDYDQALSVAMRVMKNSQKDSQEYMDAWTRIVSVCTASEDYAKLSALLEGCDSAAVREKYANYLIYDPVFITLPGTYDGQITVELEAKGDGTIFYTLNGDAPSDKSMMYNGGISLGPGIYTVKAVFINRYGLKSSIVSGTFQVIAQEDED